MLTFYIPTFATASVVKPARLAPLSPYLSGMAFRRLSETTFQEAAPERIDEALGILYGVRLLGMKSANGREYTESCCKKAVPLYEGAKGYANHPKRKDLAEDRDIREWTVVYQNPRFVEGSGVHGDAHLLKSDPLFPKIIEAAKRFPKSIGFSHVADGDTKKRGGTEVVESIKEVFSVDLVCNPATTNGLFESRQQSQPQSLEEVIEILPEGLANRTKLIEAISDAWPVSGGPAADPQQQITMALLAAVVDLVKTTKEAETMNATAQAEADAAKKAADEKAIADKEKAGAGGGTSPDNKPPTLESIQRKLDLAEAKAELMESGRANKDQAVRALQVETLAEAKTPEKRKALLESWPKSDSGKQPLRESRAFERPASSPPANGGGDADREGAASKAYESRFEESAKRAQERIAKRRAR